MPLPITSPESPLDVLIVGGGLSGLIVAFKLSQLPQFQPQSSGVSSRGTDSNYRGLKWHLFESQPQLGGRIQNDSLGYNIDMGGAWVWPEHQPLMKSLLNKFNLEDTIMQSENTMRDGRVRIKGGAAQIIYQLENNLNTQDISLLATVVSCTRLADINVIKVEFTLNDSATTIANESTIQQHTVYAKYLVWTAPPRKSLAPAIHWNPPLSKLKLKTQSLTNTWMSSVTKVSFVYDEKFWDNEWIDEMKFNLYRGRQSSAMMEVFDIYDACTLSSPMSLVREREQGNDEEGRNRGAVAAFTIFALISSENESDSSQPTNCVGESDIASRIMNELLSIAPLSKPSLPSHTSTFSSWMTNYSRALIKHWPQVESVSDDPHPKTVGNHPKPQMSLAKAEWPAATNTGNSTGKSMNGEGRMMIYFAGTESDQSSPGLMEGAVGAAHRVVEEMKVNLCI